MTKPSALSPSEVANLGGISTKTVYRMINDGRLPAFRPAGTNAVRIRREDVERVIFVPIPAVKRGMH